MRQFLCQVERPDVEATMGFQDRPCSLEMFLQGCWYPVSTMLTRDDDLIKNAH